MFSSLLEDLLESIEDSEETKEDKEYLKSVAEFILNPPTKTE